MERHVSPSPGLICTGHLRLCLAHRRGGSIDLVLHERKYRAQIDLVGKC
jgi:hypothetical protein